MTAGTTSIRAQSHSLTPLAQLLSLCQRYRLPLSLLAIQLKDVASLSKQLGGERLQRLQKQLGCKDAAYKSLQTESTGNYKPPNNSSGEGDTMSFRMTEQAPNDRRRYCST